MDWITSYQYTSFTTAHVVLNGLPASPPGTIAHLVYGGPSMTTLGYAVLRGANGPFRISVDAWRLLQLLQRSGSRFI